MGQDRRHKYSVSQCCASANMETNTIHQYGASFIWPNPTKAVNLNASIRCMECMEKKQPTHL